MFVKERFKLLPEYEDHLRDLTPQFGYSGFGEFVFYRTYSRIKNSDNGYLFGDDSQENWADVVIRATNGCFSIRKDWYIKNHIKWDEDEWQRYACDFSLSMFHMHWLPPGRGLWVMGTPFVYQRGSMSLYNCAYTDLGDDFPSDLSWMMDCLMHAVGVGFSPIRNDKLELRSPKGKYDYQIQDTREDWCQSTKSLLLAYVNGSALPIFDYSIIRKKGLPIKGFGGIASGPEPLQRLHRRIVEFCERFRESKEYDSVRLKADIANCIGCCVVAGNVRRSAELACGPVSDRVFMNLKNYSKYPDRASHGWMSNNSVTLNSHEDFEKLGEIAELVKRNGEPGYINLRNLPLGRIGKNDGLRPDKATGFNPCGEIPLEDKEVCNVVETCPTVCDSIDEWNAALEFATFYTSTIALLPTHSAVTNRVVARNRRIGVGIVDVSGWKHVNGVYRVTRWLREGYQIVKSTNVRLNEEAGVPPAIRVTTVKPGGTVPNLPGRTSGVGNPNFHFMIRRARVQTGGPVAKILIEANVPNEPDLVSQRTTVFEFPVRKGPAKEAGKVSIWEQAMNIVWMQREWADNAVSNTLNFRPKWNLCEVIKSGQSIDGMDNLIFELNRYLGLRLATDLILNTRIKAKEYEVPERYKVELDWEDLPAWADSDSFSRVTCIRVYEYDPLHEEDDIEAVLSAIMPLTKSGSLLPHTSYGVYPQMPEEGISEEEYNDRMNRLPKIDWSKLRNSDGLDEAYCDSGRCEVVNLLLGAKNEGSDLR